MQSAEQILMILALGLFAIFQLNNNIASGSREIGTINNETVIAGTAIAQSMINEIKSKAFDEKTVSQYVPLPNSLTSIDSLGRDPDEYYYTNYDDIDDYNNHQRTESVGRLGEFHTLVKVYYVKLSPIRISTVRTFVKEVDVSVFNSTLTDTLKFKQFVAY